MIKQLFLLVLLLVSSLNAMDARLKQYPEAKALYEKAKQDNANAAFNLAIFYDDTLNDYEKAIYWYTSSDKMGYAM